MNSRKQSGSGIFLMEMIMVCGFFLLSAAVCIQVFLKADSMSRLAREKNQAVLAAESLADTWKAYGMEGLQPASNGEAAPEVYWNAGWERTGEEGGEPCFYAQLMETSKPAEGEEGVLSSLRIEIGRGEGHSRWRELGKELLFTLEVKRYIPAGGDSDGKK